MGGVVRQKREQLHPARIDAGERLVVGRGQAGHGPVIALGPPPDRDAGRAVEAENVEDVVSLRAAEELLKAGDVFEAIFERFRTLVGVGQVRRAFDPGTLLVRTQELAQTLGDADSRPARSRTPSAEVSSVPPHVRQPQRLLADTFKCKASNRAAAFMRLH